MKNETFTSFLEQKFMDRGEWNETGITKDNFESGFEEWLQNQDAQDIISYADIYADKIRKEITAKAKEVLLEYTEPKLKHSGRFAGELATMITGVKISL